MTTMQLKVKKPEEELKRLFFDKDIKRAAGTRGLGLVNPNATHEWTEVAELRLFSKAIYFKPAGVNRHFNIGQLVNYMCNIYEDEEDTDFEVFLTPEDFKLYQKRREITNKPDIIIFKPSYKIRPTPDMIMERLREFFNMSIVENHEYLPEVFTNKSDFSLADFGRETPIELVKSEDADRSTPTIPRRKKGDHSRSGSPSLSTLSKKRKALAIDSRSSSPAVTATKKH